MITVDELNRIREVSRTRLFPESKTTRIRMAVCMATGGLASGAKAVMQAVKDEVSQLDQVDFDVVANGCIGLCQLDPLVDIYKPGEKKVTYVKMTPEKVRRVIREHILGGRIVTEYTLHLGGDVILNDSKPID